MNIQQAAREAVAERKHMTRSAWVHIMSKPCSAAFKLLPTNTPDCCIAVSVYESSPRKGWQPSAEDLMAEDWVVVD